LNEKILKKNNPSTNNHDSNFILKTKKETLKKLVQNESELKKPYQFKAAQSKRKCINEVFPQINLKTELLNHFNNNRNNNNNNNIIKNINNNQRYGSYSSNCLSSESSNEYDCLNDIDYPLEKLNILY